MQSDTPRRNETVSTAQSSQFLAQTPPADLHVEIDHHGRAIINQSTSALTFEKQALRTYSP